MFIAFVIIHLQATTDYVSVNFEQLVIIKWNYIIEKFIIEKPLTYVHLIFEIKLACISFKILLICVFDMY